jgi:hypothetical protein
MEKQVEGNRGTPAAAAIVDARVQGGGHISLRSNSRQIAGNDRSPRRTKAGGLPLGRAGGRERGRAQRLTTEDREELRRLRRVKARPI